MLQMPIRPLEIHSRINSTVNSKVNARIKLRKDSMVNSRVDSRVLGSKFKNGIAWHCKARHGMARHHLEIDDEGWQAAAKLT